MKRIVCILFILLMILIMGCSNRKSNDAVPEPTTTPYLVAYTTPELTPDLSVLDFPLSFKCEREIYRDGTIDLTIYSDDIAYYGTKIREAVHAVPDGYELAMLFYLNESEPEWTMMFLTGGPFWGILSDYRSGEKVNHTLKSEDDLYYYFPQLFMEDLEEEMILIDQIPEDSKTKSFDACLKYINDKELFPKQLSKTDDEIVHGFDEALADFEGYEKTESFVDGDKRYFLVTIYSDEDEWLPEIIDSIQNKVQIKMSVATSSKSLEKCGKQIIFICQYCIPDNKVLFAMVNSHMVYEGWK